MAEQPQQPTQQPTQQAADTLAHLEQNRHKINDSLSSAFFWIPKSDQLVQEYTPEGKPDEKKPPHPADGLFVPRPDRNLGTLQNLSLWGGLLGLDHFYLRSPATGILKLLTLGFLGLWWVWDIVQTWSSEGQTRTLNYGLVSPFDLWTGIGQGMIYNGESKGWQYEQKTSFSLWMFSAIFGFTGMDMFVLGRFWLGFRKLLVFLIGMSVILSLSSAGFFGIIWAFFVLMFFIGLTLMWFNDVNKILNNPQKIMTEPITVPQTAKDSFGWFRKLYEDPDDPSKIIGQDPETDPEKKRVYQEWESLNEHYTFKDITPKELLGRFWIAHGLERPESDNQTVSKAKESSSGVPPITLTIRIMTVVGHWIYETVESILLMTPMAPSIIAAKAAQEARKAGMKAMKGDFSGLTKLASKVPGLPGLPGGIEKAVSGATQALQTAQSSVSGITQTAQAVAGAASGLTGAATNPLQSIAGAAKGLLGQAQPALTPQQTPQQTPQPTPPATQPATTQAQAGGSYKSSEEPLSTEAQIMGATILALIVGGSVKGLVDYML